MKYVRNCIRHSRMPENVRQNPVSGRASRRALARPSRAPSKRTKPELFYIACVSVAGVLSLLAVWNPGETRKQSDHPAQWLEAPGVIPWDTLRNVRYDRKDGKPVLNFSHSIAALDGKGVKLRGYITPLELGQYQAHFILSSKPSNCSFCMPAGPDEMVEVHSKTPIKFSLDPVTVSGTFAILPDDPNGLFYRLADGGSVPSQDRL